MMHCDIMNDSEQNGEHWRIFSNTYINITAHLSAGNSMLVGKKLTYLSHL